MKEYSFADGSVVYYDYDEFQDMLYVTFARDVGPTYYTDVDGLDGVMLRHDGQNNNVIGITVHNVRAKMERMLIEDLYHRLIRTTEPGRPPLVPEMAR